MNFTTYLSFVKTQRNIYGVMLKIVNISIIPFAVTLSHSHPDFQSHIPLNHLYPLQYKLPHLPLFPHPIIIPHLPLLPPPPILLLPHLPMTLIPLLQHPNLLPHHSFLLPQLPPLPHIPNSAILNQPPIQLLNLKILYTASQITTHHHRHHSYLPSTQPFIHFLRTFLTINRPFTTIPPDHGSGFPNHNPPSL